MDLQMDHKFLLGLGPDVIILATVLKVITGVS